MKNPQQAGGTVGVNRIFHSAKIFACNGDGENRPGTQAFHGQGVVVASCGWGSCRWVLSDRCFFDQLVQLAPV